MTLAELFPDTDYRFNFRFERGSISEFFRPTTQREQLLALRRFWLQTAPQTYAALLPEGAPLLEATISLARAEETLSEDSASALVSQAAPWQRCLELGAAWEPDFLLLKPDPQGALRLVGGCVCFPSSWSLTEKLAHPVETIHGVVPGLNSALGKQIDGFLKKLRPGAAWLRANWGLSRSPELNQHPNRNLPRLDAGVALEEVWLRIEHQILTALPQTDGVLFGIRIAVHPLTEIRADPLLGPRLIRALQTIPEPMAKYKNLADARARLIELLS